MVTDREALRELEPAAVRAAIGDGSYGGPYAVPDEDALRVWQAGVAEVRALIESRSRVRRRRASRASRRRCAGRSPGAAGSACRR